MGLVVTRMLSDSCRQAEAKENERWPTWQGTECLVAFPKAVQSFERMSSANANGRSNKAVSEAGGNTPKIENTGSDLGDVSLHKVW